MCICALYSVLQLACSVLSFILCSSWHDHALNAQFVDARNCPPAVDCANALVPLLSVRTAARKSRLRIVARAEVQLPAELPRRTQTETFVVYTCNKRTIRHVWASTLTRAVLAASENSTVSANSAVLAYPPDHPSSGKPRFLRDHPVHPLPNADRGKSDVRASPARRPSETRACHSLGKKLTVHALRSRTEAMQVTDTMRTHR